MSKKAVIRQNLFSGIFFITKKLAYEKKNKKNKHHFLSENCSTFFTRKFRAIKKILILVISIEAHLPTVRRRTRARTRSAPSHRRKIRGCGVKKSC